MSRSRLHPLVLSLHPWSRTIHPCQSGWSSPGLVTCPKPFPKQPPSLGELGAAAWGCGGTAGATQRGATALWAPAAKALQAEQPALPPGVPRGLRAARPPVELLKQGPAPGVTLQRESHVCAHQAGCPGVTGPCPPRQRRAQPHLGARSCMAKGWGLAGGWWFSAA